MTGGALPTARRVHRSGDGPAGPVAGHVRLDYDGRLIRRKRLVSEEGVAFVVDLAQVTGVDAGDRFELSDGRLIEVAAADEALVEVRGDLARLAWHIGNRHTPCQVLPDRLVIRQDHVLEGMLTGLGAMLSRVTGSFRPEGGAYGMGRPMGHDHGSRHRHEHGHDHPHAHDHGHHHAHDHGSGHARDHDHSHHDHTPTAHAGRSRDG